MNQRGIALPTALIALAILSALIIAFVTLAGNEPVIAGNHLVGTQAQALAESGVERAIWALGPALGPHPGAPGVDALFGAPRAAATAPWDGTASLAIAPAAGPTVPGAFTVRLAPGAAANEVDVTSTGWFPTQASARAKRIIRTTVLSLSNRFNPPGPLNVNGDVNVSGNATIQATGDVCHRPGTPATGTYSAGRTEVGGSARVCAGASCSTNGTNCVGPSCTQWAPDAPQVFDGLRFSREELEMLKSMAKLAGTYWGPGQLGGAPGSWNGRITFSSNSSALPNGVVFIDTINGAAPDPANPSNFADVRISGESRSGWLIVMGSLDISSNTTYSGLVYVVDDLTAGNGTATINGAVIAHNLNNSNATQIDTSANGTITFNYDCAALDTGGGRIPQGFFVKPGTWREVSG
jgi:hypothetical protein